MTKFRAVLFDLDGTLLDTLEDLAVSMNLALSRLGFPTHPIQEYRNFVGDGVRILARRVLPPAHLDEQTVGRCVELMLQEYERRWNHATRPYPGVPELLSSLAARKLRMAILSNKQHDFTCLTVSRLLPEWHFDKVIGARREMPCKPDPGGALQIARELGLAPDEFLYVGDTNTDMQTARAAGMFPVGALWGFRTAEELRASGAEVLINRPPDLLNVLQKSDLKSKTDKSAG